MGGAYVHQATLDAKHLAAVMVVPIHLACTKPKIANRCRVATSSDQVRAIRSLTVIDECFDKAFFCHGQISLFSVHITLSGFCWSAHHGFLSRIHSELRMPSF